jgi:molybdopterin converting factor small subunit
VLARRVRDERGEIRRHVNVFVDGEDAKRAKGVDTEVGAASTVHVINAVSGG